jgi:hypothetical protein
VEDRVLDRVEVLAKLLEEVGMDVHLPAQRGRCSGIVIASSPVTSHQVLHGRLLLEDVRCSLRDTGVRFAPTTSPTTGSARAVNTLRGPRSGVVISPVEPVVLRNLCRSRSVILWGLEVSISANSQMAGCCR